MCRPFVEQVCAERHRIANLATEQVGNLPAGRVALNIQAGDFERGQHLVGSARRGDHARGSYRGLVTAQPFGDEPANGVEREHVLTDDGLPCRFKAGEVRGVRVGLAEADQAGISIELDDGTQCIRLVHADGVQQWRVDERHRGDARPGDANRLAGHQCTASAASASASTARPAAMIARSSAISSAVGITSGGRTAPASIPSSATPALINDTA